MYVVPCCGFRTVAGRKVTEMKRLVAFVAVAVFGAAFATARVPHRSLPYETASPHKSWSASRLLPGISQGLYTSVQACGASSGGEEKPPCNGFEKKQDPNYPCLNGCNAWTCSQTGAADKYCVAKGGAGVEPCPDGPSDKNESCTIVQ
jgi:hypothetical protein